MTIGTSRLDSGMDCVPALPWVRRIEAPGAASTWAMCRREGAPVRVARPEPRNRGLQDGVDRTLLPENLKLTTGVRVVKMISALRFAEAVRRSRPKARTT